MISKKKILTIFMTALLCFSLTAPVMGYEMSDESFEYVKNKLQGFNIPDETLRNMSGWDIWVEDQYIDPESKATYIYFDHDMGMISGYWIFAEFPELKEDYIKWIQKSNRTDPSPEEIIAFLDELEEKYPVKRVRAGLVDFITVENKEILLSESAEKDRRMIQITANAISEGLENEAADKEKEDTDNNSTPGFGMWASVLGILGALICFKWMKRQKT
jgi:hypothetical protein